jgi:hypothetical protein
VNCSNVDGLKKPSSLVCLAASEIFSLACIRN